MFEGTRLSYIVPGYTGHIPNIQRDDVLVINKQDPRYQIPGYEGYVNSIKCENIFGKTYGKITYAISAGDLHQGQDVPPSQRYKSMYGDIYMNQNEVLQRTAAEIVGVQANKFNYNQVYIYFLYIQLQQKYCFQIQKTENLKNSNFWQQQQQLVEKQKENQNNQKVQEDFQKSVSQFYGDENKQTLKLGTPLPGYTGTNKRIVAANIFGQTFANARKTAIQDQHNIDQERVKNFITQSTQIPKIVFQVWNDSLQFAGETHTLYILPIPPVIKQNKLQANNMKYFSGLILKFEEIPAIKNTEKYYPDLSSKYFRLPFIQIDQILNFDLSNKEEEIYYQSIQFKPKYLKIENVLSDKKVKFQFQECDSQGKKIGDQLIIDLTHSQFKFLQLNIQYSLPHLSGWAFSCSLSQKQNIKLQQEQLQKQDYQQDQL
ncbi:hypothetical protein IMG5_179410 [Ichthyophthirius multifiliis]|uniref:Uncharacterized protein n=1 Tax=Ichthyophthirius multifiliis TaxID=5932 RepID=G0R2M0_ICHMU|nr:hypothetical protein IMG5_179410 [Ichthyophthirius multifiliis]EGR28284.1 hypothetical protein IMG5_179410 [Ichthyophthirius multifiliis]|eukprot:XP_004027629.1 hypothetical protein IMG5_179410 [Ichthyophthirius multifiliis]